MKKDRDMELRAKKSPSMPSAVVLPRIYNQSSKNVTPGRGRNPSVMKSQSTLQSEYNIRSIQLDRNVLR